MINWKTFTDIIIKEAKKCTVPSKCLSAVPICKVSHPEGAIEIQVSANDNKILSNMFMTTHSNVVILEYSIFLPNIDLSQTWQLDKDR